MAEKKEELVRPRTPMQEPWGWELPNLTKEQAQWLDEWFSIRKLSAAAATPRICSQDCRIKSRCPLNSLQQVSLPIGCPCPIESTQIRIWANHMRETLAIDKDDPWSLMQLEYAAMWTVLMERTLSEPGADKVMIKSYRGVDREGNALYEMKVNPAMVFAEKIQRIIDHLGKSLIATREAKAKLQQLKQVKGPEEALLEIKAKFITADEGSADKYNKIRDKSSKRAVSPESSDPLMPSIPQPEVHKDEGS